MNQSNQKINLLVVPISWVIAAIVAIVLGVCGYEWLYYLIGVCTGLLNFGIMVKNNRTMELLMQANPEQAEYAAKKHAWFGILLRLLVFFAVFMAIFFKEVYGNPDNMWVLVIAFGGYATVKFVLIAVYVVYFLVGKKVKEE